jgi:hypothetical protein
VPLLTRIFSGENIVMRGHALNDSKSQMGRQAMTAMTMDFDGVRELSLDEIDEVAGAGIGDAIGDFIEAANDLWDEVPTEVQAVAVVGAAALICAPAGPVASAGCATAAAVGVLTTGT